MGDVSGKLRISGPLYEINTLPIERANQSGTIHCAPCDESATLNIGQGD